MTPEYAPLRDSIRRCVNQSGLTQAYLAGTLGLSQKHLSYMLLGKSNMSLEWAARIADACSYELTIDVTPKIG